ncbi:TonB-dependent receptor [Luteimonas saliphila]|uniref:TonB-dependent receptor n=1 Tax=Luteimonas saliphila TaxID=2804919 RepID=UPI00192DFE11|nr:TonB-dependent receptor [Luteimonas saliphila]
MIKRSCLCAALLLALAGTTPVLAQSEARHAVELQAQDLGTALKLLAQQTKLQIVYSADLVQGKRAPALDGSLTATEALSELLRGTGLKYEFLDPQTVTLSPLGAAAQRLSGGAGQASASGSAGDAERGASATPPASAQQDQLQPATGGRDQALDLEKVVVTGTRIRGGATPSPVIAIGSERIREEGFTDLGEVIRSVPQNSSGGQNPGVLMGNVIGAGVQNQNLTGGSALNLRGLGPDASLTLLNGRRMVYSGFVQAIDISAIPIEAVEQIEIVADGASAIYGSDAVGGVANVILKRDFDGFALGASYGGATDGGLTTREYTATAGSVWASGGLIATFKDVSIDPVYAREREYTAHLMDPQMLLPSSDLQSGLLSAYQSLGDSAELRLDALRTAREQLYYFYGTSPAFYNVLTPETTTTLVSSSLDFFLSNDWTLSIAGAWGKDDFIENQSRFTFATGAITPLVFGCYCNRSRAYEVGAEGPLFETPAGDARLAVGVGYRENEITLPSYLTSGVSTPRGDESSRFAYAEMYLPLISSDASIGGVHRFDITAAVRGEDYDSFGRVRTPKLGLIYGPSADLTFKTSWGRSFKAPTLLQILRPHAVQVRLASSVGAVGYPANALVLASFGGKPDLDPERARVWTTSMAIHPNAIPGLEAELTWFDIDYTDRIVEPITNIVQAMSNPAFAEFIQLNPTAQEQAALIASDYDGVILNSTGLSYDPRNVVAIVNGRYINAVRQRIRGLDLSGSYGIELGVGRLTIRGSTSWLDSAQQSTDTTFDLAGTLHNPTKISSRIGAIWNQGGLIASVFANYKSGVRNVVEDEKLASFTTVDATIRYAADRNSGAWSDLEFALSAQNLFDRPPSLYTIAANRQHVPPYDSTNYSPVGRFLNFSISKRW